MQLRITERAGAGFGYSKKLALLFVLVLLCFSFSCSKGTAGLSTSPSPNGSPAPSPSFQISTGPTSAPAPASSQLRKAFKSGEAVPAGYLGYKVSSSWYSNHLPGQNAGKSPSAANYLYIDLSIVNTGQQELAPGPFTLLDEKQKEYRPSEQGWKMEKSLGQIGRLAPGVGKRGFLIFEAPQHHQYKLKLQGFFPADEITIELSPMTAPPSP